MAIPPPVVPSRPESQSPAGAPAARAPYMAMPIQDSTRQNIHEMEAASEAVGRSTELAHQADEALEFIVRTAESNAGLVAEISTVVTRRTHRLRNT